MGLGRLLAKGAAVALVVGMVVAFFPVVVALVVGTNWRGAADGLGGLPGISHDAPVSTAVVGFGYGVVCWALLFAGGAGALGVGLGDVDGSIPTASDTTAPADRQATVVDVVDGDTVDVRFTDGSFDTVRLLGVDAPETRGETYPAEFEGVADDAAGRQCLAESGAAATAFVERAVEDETVTLRFDALAPTRGDYDRLLAYVVVDGASLNRRLVAAGHARVYDSTFERTEAFYAAETEARAASAGLWSCRRTVG
ncbi:thermonuclease family protein [Halorubrum sp. SY-15]|uniref:thermonuclease family protein n=1 Tax=Halorubrum sp. SY-15 TaxID=3402277 RepID=UPI003EB826CC